MESEGPGNSVHPEREFQTMGLPLSFGNSNSRQARAAAAAAAPRRPLDGQVPSGSIVHRPPPPPSQLFSRPLPPPLHAYVAPSYPHQQPQLPSHDARLQQQFSIPPPPTTSHIRPMFRQQPPLQQHPQSSSHVRASPYGTSADNSARGHRVGVGQRQGAHGASMDPAQLLKDSMFGNPWRGCLRNV
jgi:hypothetical protein